MSKKTIAILLGIFIALALAASYSWWKQYVRFGKKPSVNTELNFAAFTENTTDKILITKSGAEEINIEKNGTWKVNGFDADQEEISNFFKILSELVIKQIVSKNPDNRANYEVDEEKGRHLALTSSKVQTTFIIGKRGVALNSFYARRIDSNNVYAVSGALLDKISQDVTAWRNKIVADIQKETIQKIEVVSQTKPLVVIKGDNGWRAERLNKSVSFDEATANRLLAAFNPLKATGFLDEREQKEFQNAKNKTIIRIFDDRNNAVAEIQLLEKENDWWAQVSGKDTYYKIASHKLSDIFLSDQDIFKE